MSMRRVVIIRKDLHLKPGKLMAMSMHLAEAFWTNFLKAGLVKDMEWATLPVETEDDPDYWMLYRHPAVYAAAKAAHERGEKTFKYKEEFSEPYYLLTQKIDKDIWDEYVNGIFTKTICEARNLDNMKSRTLPVIEELGLIEGLDWGYINDKCLTDLTPENEDGTTTIGMWFKPLKDEDAFKISKKFKLYRDE